MVVGAVSRVTGVALVGLQHAGGLAGRRRMVLLLGGLMVLRGLVVGGRRGLVTLVQLHELVMGRQVVRMGVVLEGVVVLRGRGQGLRGRGRRQRDLLGRRLRQGLRGRGLRLHGHVLRLEGVPRVHVQSLLLDAPHARVRAGVLVVPGRRAGGGRQRQLLLHVVRPAARRLPVRPEAGRADVLLVAALARVGALVGVQPLVKLQVDELGELGGAQITGVRLLTRV